MANRRPTLAQIAEEAGVSVPTVSKVVNGHLDVSPETRRTVERLLAEHRYRPRRTQSAARTGIIDLVFLDLGGPWAMQILTGVEQVTYESGLSVAVSAVQDLRGGRSNSRWLEQIRARGSDGVVLVLSELSATQRAQLELLGVPVVLVDPVGIPARDIPAVGATNWSGGMAATEHLLERGHERIAVISGPQHLLCSRARVDGYQSALTEAGLSPEESYIRYADFRGDGGYTATLELLCLPKPPTAIFAASDQMALGAYEALFERGLQVPEDVSVVGFDDLPQSRWAVPPLTTIRQPLTEMAQMATRILLRLISGEEPETRRVELSTPLVERASTTHV